MPRPAPSPACDERAAVPRELAEPPRLARADAASRSDARRLWCGGAAEASVQIMFRLVAAAAGAAAGSLAFVMAADRFIAFMRVL